ncbi:MAG: NosD domain-containing protein [Thermoproteota archaeon]
MDTSSCAGFTSECGIFLEKVNNVTLRNVRVVDFENGIGFNFSSGNNLVECTFSGNNLAGVFLYSSNNNIVN